MLFRRLLFAFLLPLTALPLSAQDSLGLIALNSEIDQLVIAKKTHQLEKIYGEDFIFSHGTGLVEGKRSWLHTVNHTEYIRRDHDSVLAEIHGKVALVKGRMHIEKKNGAAVDRYHLRYVRLFKLRKRKWELISHTTTAEWHD